MSVLIPVLYIGDLALILLTFCFGFCVRFADVCCDLHDVGLDSDDVGFGCLVMCVLDCCDPTMVLLMSGLGVGALVLALLLLIGLLLIVVWILLICFGSWCFDIFFKCLVWVLVL